jgi:hypothetical protein
VLCKYTVLESNQPVGLRRPNSASVGRCIVANLGIEPSLPPYQSGEPPLFSLARERLPDRTNFTDTVKVEGFEPPPSRSQAERSTKLSYTLFNQSGWQDSNLHQRVPETRGQPLTHILMCPCGQSVRRDSNPRDLGGNQAGSRSPHERTSTSAKPFHRPHCGQSVRRDLNPRDLDGNQAGCR